MRKDESGEEMMVAALERKEIMMAKRKSAHEWEFNGVRTSVDLLNSEQYQHILTSFREMGSGNQPGDMVTRYRTFFDDILGDGYGEKLIDADDNILALECIASFLDFCYDKMLRVPGVIQRLSVVDEKRGAIFSALSDMPIAHNGESS